MFKKILSLLSVLALSFSFASTVLVQTPDKPAEIAGLSGGVAASENYKKANADDVKVFHNTSDVKFYHNISLAANETLSDEKSTATGEEAESVPNGTLIQAKTPDFRSISLDFCLVFIVFQADSAENMHVFCFFFLMDGARTSKTVSGATTQFILDTGGAMVGEIESDGTKLLYIFDASGNKIGFSLYNSSNTLTGTYDYVFNAQGDVTALLQQNVSGGYCFLVATYQYDAWGKLISSTDTSSTGVGALNPIRYRGYYYDAETGFYATGSRYYAPVVGRFLNMDDQLNPSVLGKNSFAYCENNPIMYSDPDGHFAFLAIAIAFGVGFVAGAAGQFISDCVSSAMNGQWHFSNWQTYVGAMVGGGVGGTVLLFTGNSVAASAAAAATSTFVGQELENITGGQRRSQVQILENTAISGAIGAATGLLFPMKVQGVTAGRNSMGAVFQSGTTKLINATAATMSVQVMAKGAVAQTVRNIPGAVTTGIGFSSYISNLTNSLTGSQPAQYPTGQMTIRAAG